MRMHKSLLGFGFMLVLFFSLTILTYATDETESTATGFVEIKVIVPSDFTNFLSVNLKHENGTSYTIPVHAENEYKAREEVESGLYITHVEIVADEKEDEYEEEDEEGSYCPSCIPRSYTIKHSAFLVVERNRNNFFEVRIIDQDNEENNAVPNSGKKEEEIENSNRGVMTDLFQKPVEYLGGEHKDELLKEKISPGKNFLKRSKTSLFILIALCIVSLVIKAKNKL